MIAWAIAEARATAVDRPQPGTLATATGVVLFAGHVAGVIEHIVYNNGCIAGAAVMAAGIALRLWAIATLGEAFQTALGARRLVATGPYRWMRHPSEVGLVVAAAGGAVLLGSWLAALAAAILVPLSVARARREDRSNAHLDV